jgi:putative hemolysin
VQQRYRYKNLKAAMCHIPDGKELGGTVSTKVAGWCVGAGLDVIFCGCFGIYVQHASSAGERHASEAVGMCRMCRIPDGKELEDLECCSR